MFVAWTFRHRAWSPKWPWAQPLVQDYCSPDTNDKNNRNLLLEFSRISWLPKGTLSSQNRLYEVRWGLLANECLLNKCLNVWQNWAWSGFHCQSCVCRGGSGLLTDFEFFQGLLLTTRKRLRAMRDRTGLSETHNAPACSVLWPFFLLLLLLIFGGNPTCSGMFGADYIGHSTTSN